MRPAPWTRSKCMSISRCKLINSDSSVSLLVCSCAFDAFSFFTSSSRALIKRLCRSRYARCLQNYQRDSMEDLKVDRLTLIDSALCGVRLGLQ
jgi:hypothetical protein